MATGRRSSSPSSSAWLTRMLMLACLAGAAFGFATSPQKAVLNALTAQANITQLTNELNPYGLAPVTFSMGKLQAGNFLTTQWNDAQGRFGQGRTILQVTPQGVATPFATIDPNAPLVTANCGNVGVGLTMGLVILKKGYVVVGSTPVPIGGSVAGTGCLMVLDSNGTLVDTHASMEPTSTPGLMTGGGPWAMALQESPDGSNANLYVSYVLGTCPACNDTQTGANGGMVVRYQLQVPGNSIPPNFWGNSPDVIASGFPTRPGMITGGVVGPTGLLVGHKNGNYPHQLHDRLFIADNLGSTISVVQGPGGCFTRPGYTPQCSLAMVATQGLINGPIGLAQSPIGTIVGANGNVGTLFEIAPTPGANLQLADQLVDNVNAPAVGAGTLFNVMFHPARPNVLVFNDDNFNTYNTLTMPAATSGRKMLRAL